MSQRNGELQARDREREEYQVVFKNNSGETIPPHAIMQIESASACVVKAGNRRFITVIKPNSTTGQYIINGPLSVAVPSTDNTGYGRGRILGPMVIRFTGSTPAVG